MPITASTDASASAGAFRAITPADGATYPGARGLYVGTGGNVAVVGLDGSVVVFVNVSSGAILPIYSQGVNATNTTASSIIALL